MSYNLFENMFTNKRAMPKNHYMDFCSCRKFNNPCKSVEFVIVFGLEIRMSCLLFCHQMSRVTRKPTFCICENKDADQLRGNREADQRLCFRYTDSTIPLLSNLRNFKPLAIFCSCTAWFVLDLVGNQNVGFLMKRLKYF